jgi:hypothetical protein
MRSRYLSALLVGAAIVLPSVALAQESRSGALARELVSLLDAAKTDCAAARMPGSQDEFVAIMHFPGAQLLAISAKYSAPALLNERLIQRNFKEVYLDLNAATDPATRVVIEDLQSDGLKFKNDKDEPSDYYTKGTAPRFQFDGLWKKRKLQEDEYRKVYDEADGVYTRMLEAAIAELKKGS